MSEYLRPEYTPLFREVQETIAGYLNSDPQISAKQIEFIPEARLDIDFQVKKALGQQGIVGVVNTLKGEFAGHDGSTNAWQIEAEVDVIENPPVRRAQLKKMGLSTGTVSDIIDWVQESMCGPSSPTFARFSPVTQEIGEEKGLVVGRSIMRSIVIADVSAVISGGNQWKCPYALEKDLSALAAQVQEIEGGLSSLDNYLPLSGGTLTGDLGLQKTVGGIRPLIHNLGFDGRGMITHTLFGQGGIVTVLDTLLLPTTRDGQDKTLATEEWTEGQISGKVDSSQLSAYLPLSGGTMQGGIEIPSPYDLSVGLYQLQDKDFDGFQIGDGWDYWKFGGSSEQPNDVMRRTDISAFIKATAMTQEEYDEITPDPTTLYVITES